MIRATQSGEAMVGRSAEPVRGRGEIIFTGRLVRTRRARAVAFTETAPEPTPPSEPVRRPARVARMLALAHHIETSIGRGLYQDRADAARQLGVTRARITQLLDLTLLAPDIQESILFMEAVDGVEPITERGLRKVLASPLWHVQRAARSQDLPTA